MAGNPVCNISKVRQNNTVFTSVSRSSTIPFEMQVKKRSSFVAKYLYIRPMLMPAFFEIMFMFAFLYPLEENSSMAVSRISFCLSGEILSNASLLCFFVILIIFVSLHKAICLLLCNSNKGNRLSQNIWSKY